ncbi:hypothetical protein HDV05_006740 [Chytridiales sp. JEL 0842]|nr:hypothetical protein HDV05_006740 [Chytridiales sp. JEL 0842]
MALVAPTTPLAPPTSEIRFQASSPTPPSQPRSTASSKVNPHPPTHPRASAVVSLKAAQTVQSTQLARALSRVASLEKTVEFLQESHKVSLVALHKEIERLQGVCAENNYRTIVLEEPPIQYIGEYETEKDLIEPTTHTPNQVPEPSLPSPQMSQIQPTPDSPTTEEKPYHLLLQQQKRKYQNFIERINNDNKRKQAEIDSLKAELALIRDVLAVAGLDLDLGELKGLVAAKQKEMEGKKGKKVGVLPPINPGGVAATNYEAPELQQQDSLDYRPRSGPRSIKFKSSDSVVPSYNDSDETEEGSLPVDMDSSVGAHVHHQWEVMSDGTTVCETDVVGGKFAETIGSLEKVLPPIISPAGPKADTGSFSRKLGKGAKKQPPPPSMGFLASSSPTPAPPPPVVKSTSSSLTWLKKMKGSKMEEEFDENYEPTEDEIIEYAKFLGMDVENEKHLLWIARESLKAPLPPNWKPCQTEDNNIYYFNFSTGESIWDHPCDEHYRKLYEREKAKSASSKPTQQQQQQPSEKNGSNASITTSKLESSATPKLDSTDSFLKPKTALPDLKKPAPLSSILSKPAATTPLSSSRENNNIVGNGSMGVLATTQQRSTAVFDDDDEQELESESEYLKDNISELDKNTGRKSTDLSSKSSVRLGAGKKDDHTSDFELSESKPIRKARSGETFSAFGSSASFLGDSATKNRSQELKAQQRLEQIEQAEKAKIDEIYEKYKSKRDKVELEEKEKFEIAAAELAASTSKKLSNVEREEKLKLEERMDEVKAKYAERLKTFQQEEEETFQRKAARLNTIDKLNQEEQERFEKELDSIKQKYKTQLADLQREEALKFEESARSLRKETEHQIEQLQSEEKLKLDSIRETSAQNIHKAQLSSKNAEDVEASKLKAESATRLQQLRQELETEFQTYQSNLRDSHTLEIESFTKTITQETAERKKKIRQDHEREIANLETENKELLESLRAKYENAALEDERKIVEAMENEINLRRKKAEEAKAELNKMERDMEFTRRRIEEEKQALLEIERDVARSVAMEKSMARNRFEGSLGYSTPHVASAFGNVVEDQKQLHQAEQEQQQPMRAPTPSAKTKYKHTHMEYSEDDEEDVDSLFDDDTVDTLLPHL